MQEPNTQRLGTSPKGGIMRHRWVPVDVVMSTVLWEFVALGLLMGYLDQPHNGAEVAMDCGWFMLVALGGLVLGVAANWKGWKRG